MASEDKDKVFGELKSRWMEEKNFQWEDSGVRETQLAIRMKTLIDRMSKEMMKKGDMGIARAGCHDMIKQGVVMTHEEEEECAYILSNLWEIGTVSRVQCGRGMIDEDIKDYVRCAVMNMWSFLYHSAHCEAGRAIKAAFGAIKSMGEALSTGIKCTECEYGMLEPMVISGKRTLNYIRGAMEQNTELMKLIKGGPKPNKPCPQQPNTAPSALGPPNVATTGHEYKQTGPIVTKSATNKTKPYEFLTKLLHLWIMARGTSQLDEFETLIWDDLWKVFDDMMNNVLEDANDEKTLCAREDGNRKQILHGDNQGKELCKMLIKISLWIDGWNQKFDRINRWHWVPREREKKAKERRLQNYLRCLIGKVTMLGMFKTHCKLNKVTPVVKISMENKRKEGNVKNRSGICDEIDNASIGVGGKLIWEELENWINGYTRQANEGKGFREVVAGQSPLHTIKGEGKNGCPTGKEKEGNREETLSDLGIVVIPGEEKENKEEDNVNWKKSAIGDMLKKLKQKEDERRRASGCSPSNTNGFEEGEEDSIMEWFTKFFNNPAEDDEQYEPGKYDWSKYDKYSAICEEGADDPRFDAKKYGYFCKIMLKNLMMVTNQGNQNKPENSNTKCKRKFIPICDLLKIWMTYMGESCVPRSVMQYVFEAVENLEKEWKGEKNYEKCEYGNISNLYRGNTDIGHEVSKLLRNSTVGSKLGELNRRNWCDESRRRYWTHPDMYNKVSRSDEGTDGGRSQIEGVMKELKSLVKGVDEGIEEEEKELGDIMGTVTEVVNEVMQQQQQQQLPPPSTSAAGQVVECTDKTDLCVRADCVAERWRANREVNNVTFPDWLGTFWNNDVNSRLKKLSDAMTTDDKNNEEECESITVSGNASLEANKKACNYIVKGLKHIYNIQKDPVKITQGKNLQVEERKASDNQLFWRTMECVLLNAYADKLEQQSPCTPKAGVTHAFTAGKQLWNDICNNKGDTNCVQCTREPNFKNCEINDSKKSKKDKVEGRVNKLLNGTNGTQLQTTLAAINSLNNNTLCQRVQCVTVKWFEDRIYSETSKQNWCTFWGANDVGKVLREMSKAMTKEDGTDDHLCKNFTRTNGEAIPTEPDKKACQYITKGLRYIYNIQENPKDDYKNQKKNNRIFYQTVGCLFLNAYADRIITTCPDVDEDKIVSMFKSGNNNKDTWCKDKVNGNDCVQCERDTNYKSCTLSVKEALLNKKPGKECEHHKDNIKKKLDDMLNPNENGDQVVKPALTEINNICETVAAKPAGTTKPATTKPGKDQKPEAVENVQPINAGEKLPSLDDEHIPITGEGPIPSKDPIELNAWGSGRIESVSTSVSPENAPTFSTGTDSDPHSSDSHPSGTSTTTNAQQPEPSHSPGSGSQPTAPDAPAAVPGTANEVHKTASPAPTPALNPGGPPDGDSTQQDTEPKAVTEPDVVPQKPELPSVPGRQGPVVHAPTKKVTPSSPGTAATVGKGGTGSEGGGAIPSVSPLQSVSNNINPSELLTPYLPSIPVLIGLSAMSYLLLKYFGMLHKARKRYRRAYEVSGPPPLEEQALGHVGDQADGPHEYTLVKERKQPRSVPTGRKKQVGKRPVGQRTIIDIHLEVLDECQKVELHSTKEDFFEILVQEFMGSEFIKEENVPEEQVPMEGVT